MHAGWRAFLLVSTIIWQESIVTYGLSENTSLALPVGNLTGTRGSSDDLSGLKDNATAQIDGKGKDNGNGTYGKTLIQEYMIWPPRKASSASGKSLEEYVNGLAPGANNVYVSWSEEGKACFVVANLSVDAAAQAKKNPLVDISSSLCVIEALMNARCKTSISTWQREKRLLLRAMVPKTPSPGTPSNSFHWHQSFEWSRNPLDIPISRGSQNT